MTQRGGLYSPETARMILEVVRYLKSSGFVISPPGRGGQTLSPPTPIFVRNDSGEEVPPFACMQATGTVENGGQNYVTIDQPVDTTGEAGVYLFNGFYAIEASGFGVANDGPLVRVLTNGSTATSGDKWQPVIGSWAVAPGGTLFTAVGGDDIASDTMWASVASGGGGDGSTFYGFQTTSVGFLTTTAATADIYVLAGVGFGSIVESDADIYDPAGWALGLPSGTNGICVKQGGLYYAIQAACPPAE